VICFAHGFAAAFGLIEPDDYEPVLVAPKGQGARVRESYLAGSGIPALIGAESDRGMEFALAIAAALGSLRVGGFRTTFREEAVSDLFGEQAVLCGGVTALIKKAFRTLVSAGFSPEVAYFECMHELKIIVDIFHSSGFSGMRDLISSTAAYGGLQYGEDIIGPETEERMQKLLEFISDGNFAEDWLRVSKSGGKLEKLAGDEKALLIEKTGEKLRKLFPRKF
jgi:ketol-acid reductoisomerase